MHRRGDDRRRLAGLTALAAEAGVPLIATNDVLYHDARQRPLHGDGARAAGHPHLLGLELHALGAVEAGRHRQRGGNGSDRGHVGR